MWEAQYYHHEAPRSLITSGGLGTMGFALPAAIGAKRRPARRRGLGGRRRRRLPDDDVRAGDRGAGRDRRSRSRSSTTAISAWCGSGRSSSTSAATPRRRCSSPDFVKLAEAYGIRGIARHQARRRAAGASPTRATHAGPGRDRLPGRAGRHRLPDGARRRRPARDDSPAQPDRRNRRGRVTTRDCMRCIPSPFTSRTSRAC